jgi:predicted SnoaL-like aldol condensation-catalyzing enzyme
MLTPAAVSDTERRIHDRHREQAFDTLFNKRDYATAERLWSPGYIQRSARIKPGRSGIFAFAPVR